MRSGRCGGLDPLTATGTTVERSRALLGAEVGHYWIFDRKIFDLSGLRQVRRQFLAEFRLGHRQPGAAEHHALQGIGESQYGADAGASASLSLTNMVRVYVNYDGKFRAAMQSHQGTLGVELKW